MTRDVVVLVHGCQCGRGTESVSSGRPLKIGGRRGGAIISFVRVPRRIGNIRGARGRCVGGSGPGLAAIVLRSGGKSEFGVVDSGSLSGQDGGRGVRGASTMCRRCGRRCCCTRALVTSHTEPRRHWLARGECVTLADETVTINEYGQCRLGPRLTCRATCK